MPWPFDAFTPPVDFDEEAYGDALNDLRGFLAALAHAVPSAQLTRELLADLQRWRKELQGSRVAGDDAPYGQLPTLEDHGLASLPQIVVKHAAPELIQAKATFSRWHLGGGGVVHGGQVATAIDELMGRSQLLVGSVARTAYLNLNYRAATPYERPLDVEVRVARQEGRKVFLEARLFDSHTTYADAVALFVRVAPYSGQSPFAALTDAAAGTR